MVRVLLALLLVATACSRSDMSEVPTTGFGLAVAEAEEVIAAFPPLCEALQGKGYETRKSTLDDAKPGAVELASDACPDDITRLRAARAVEEAAADLRPDAVTIEFTRCDGTRTGFAATVTFTNTFDRPVGVFAAVRSTVEDKPSGVGAATTVWRIDPGETATREVEAATRGGTGCAIRYSTFLADPSLEGDASGPVATSPELSSDDVAVWLPALVAAEQAWWRAEDAPIDAPATTEDLRSTAYRTAVESVRDGEAGEPLEGDVAVCSHRAHPDDPGRVRVTVSIGDRLFAGAARRGADRGWRWLGTPAVLGPGPCPAPV